MKKFRSDERCEKCGEKYAKSRNWSPETGMITVRCTCGNTWERLPLDYPGKLPEEQET